MGNVGAAKGLTELTDCWNASRRGTSSVHLQDSTNL